MKTVVVDILNNEALERLQDLENLQLIRVHKQDLNNKSIINWTNKYKGAMKQQPLSYVDAQLNELRNEWE